MNKLKQISMAWSVRTLEATRQFQNIVHTARSMFLQKKKTEYPVLQYGHNPHRMGVEGVLL